MHGFFYREQQASSTSVIEIPQAIELSQNFVLSDFKL